MATEPLCPVWKDRMFCFGFRVPSRPVCSSLSPRPISHVLQRWQSRTLAARSSQPQRPHQVRGHGIGDD